MLCTFPLWLDLCPCDSCFFTIGWWGSPGLSQSEKPETGPKSVSLGNRSNRGRALLPSPNSMAIPSSFLFLELPWAPLEVEALVLAQEGDAWGTIPWWKLDSLRLCSIGVWSRFPRITHPPRGNELIWSLTWQMAMIWVQSAKENSPEDCCSSLRL